MDKVTGTLNRALNGVLANKGIAATRCNCINVIGLDRIKRATPVGEVAVTAVTGRVVFHDIAGKHDVLIWHVNDRVPGSVRAPDVLDVHPAITKVNRHAVAESCGWIGETRNALMSFKQAGEALEFAVPVFLPAFFDHPARNVGHDNLIGTVG